MMIQLECEVNTGCGCCHDCEYKFIDFDTLDELFEQILPLYNGYYREINIWENDDEEIPNNTPFDSEIQQFLDIKNKELYLKRRINELSKSIVAKQEFIDTIPKQIADTQKEIEKDMNEFNLKNKDLEEIPKQIEKIKGENKIE